MLKYRLLYFVCIEYTTSVHNGTVHALKVNIEGAQMPWKSSFILWSHF
ncbi:hypothetical protein SAMN05660236_2168 [Ohtaekwangia koreensis]|uniref:Uncharacterized protein n=1 Tax=Ohtaekwangia koreensis TaxID=688867 RepID=A0A1T5KGD4_9BACT|nr:hypothetical protein SAMN05660236_2168 [Ohtaekwangia koreensis]